MEYASWSDIALYVVAALAVAGGIFGGIWIFLDDLANQMDDPDHH